ncbi:hypothetical protein KJ673_01750 [Patescibacteria group bacterium]|nr:hypothetical protein [Patescibacteria group bacterium]MBU4453275.1 hypothetical protein [Patescibacteria group bacterium]MCG2687401.1 hypothetical protein [Candidatus Parcubacteria bacterium]
MFDTLEPIKDKETYPFLQWMDRFVMTDEFIRQARDTMYEFEAQVSQISQIHRTPQSPKHHGEGPVMTYHLERMLCALYAICAGKADLLQIDEFAREKHLKNEIIELQEILCENAATIKAFIFIHDIAKYDCITFDAPLGSRGAREGFATPQKLPTKHLIDLYLKLLRAFEVGHSSLTQSELSVAFGAEYQIKVSYKGHDKMAISSDYQGFREQIADLCRLTSRDREMVYLLVKEHIHEISFFARRPDSARYKILVALAQKAGLDGDDVLDCQLASLFLDAVVGSIACEDGKMRADINVVLNMLKSEELAVVERKQNRVKKIEGLEKKAFKTMLAGVGLGADDIFEVLKTPIGPNRAKILKEVEDAVRSPEIVVENDALQPLFSQIQKARLLNRARTR